MVKAITKPAQLTKPLGASKKLVPAKSKKNKPKVYPNVEIHECVGDNAITVARMKELLGWEEEADGAPFGDDYFLTDGWGKRVRLNNNQHNRDWTESWSLELSQKLLCRDWRMNYETFIVGEYGQVLSGQHRGIALIFAEQIRLGAPMFAGDQSVYWADYWQGEVTLETLLVLGASEDADVVATLDNVKTRTFADVLFTDPTVFKNHKKGERRAMCRITEYTVRTLWERMSMDANAHCPRRTHAEALRFIYTHPRTLKCVEHIYTEGGAKALGPRETVAPGTAAGMLYMMGCDSPDTDGDIYRNKVREGKANEKKLDWSSWDTACAFWSEVIKEFKPAADIEDRERGTMYPLREALVNLRDPDTGVDPSRNERMALIALAWQIYKADEAMDCETNLLLEYTPRDEHRIRYMVDPPVCGPVDVGCPDDAPPVPKAEKPAKFPKPVKPQREEVDPNTVPGIHDEAPSSDEEEPPANEDEAGMEGNAESIAERAARIKAENLANMQAGADEGGKPPHITEIMKRVRAASEKRAKAAPTA